MFPSENVDRRKCKNRPLSLLVDTGVICSHSLGNRAAELLYLSHNIPPSIAVRVLHHESMRRRTGLEVAMSEQGLTWKQAPLAAGDGDLKKFRWS